MVVARAKTVLGEALTGVKAESYVLQLFFNE